MSRTVVQALFDRLCLPIKGRLTVGNFYRNLESIDESESNKEVLCRRLIEVRMPECEEEWGRRSGF